MMPTISSLAVALVLAVAGAITTFVFLGSRRAGAPVARARSTALWAGALLSAWLCVSAAMGASGVLADFEARPPRMFFVLGGTVLVFALSTRSRAFTRALDAMPRAWPVALQSMRVPVELGLWSLYVEGNLPVHLTFHGRNFDVLVGLSAPLVAWGLARNNVSDRSLLLWNAAGLALLANVVGMSITTFPGPLHLAWPGPSNTIVTRVPFVWLPAFLVPVALFGHIASLRQLARTRRDRLATAS
jgi:hypothetical protein